MKFLHTSDLHIGKRLYGHSLYDDQRYILDMLLQAAREENAGAIIAAGDIYDKYVPSTEAVKLLDRFINDISDSGIPFLMISGNHDSPERLGFGDRLLEKCGIYIAGEYDGTVKMKEIGGVEFYMLPFLRPAVVRHYFPDKQITTAEDAVRAALENVNPGKKSVIISHQTVECSESELIRSESESRIIGGSDAVNYRVYDKFAYAALGHIHAPQSVGRSTVRYSGTPLKYSKSEALHTKSVTVVDINDSGVELHEHIIKPLHDIRVIRGEAEELLKSEVYSLADTEDYVYITLTDDITDPGSIARLKKVYTRCAGIEIDNTRSSFDLNILSVEEEKDDFELFKDFFFMQNNRAMTSEEETAVKKLMEDLENETY